MRFEGPILRAEGAPEEGVRGLSMEDVVVQITVSELTGPVPQICDLTCTDADLVHNARRGRPATGERIVIEGVVRDQYGIPIPNAFVELWQADANGFYWGERDRDANFLGFGRCLTDSEGKYRFFTVKPGGRGESAGHLHVALFGPSWLSRVFTRVYFEDEAEVPGAVASGTAEKRRCGMVARRQVRQSGEGEIEYQLDFAVWVPNATRGYYARVGSGIERRGEKVRLSPECGMGCPFGEALLRRELGVEFGKMVVEDTAGQRVKLRGRVADGAGCGMAGAFIEVWQADAMGSYHHPLMRAREWDEAFVGYGRAVADAEGRFEFETILPGAVEWDGTRQAPHINVAVVLPDVARILRTRVYLPASVELLREDAVGGLLSEEQMRRLLAETDGIDGNGMVTYRWEIRTGGGVEETPVFTFSERGQ